MGKIKEINSNKSHGYKSNRIVNCLNKSKASKTMHLSKRLSLQQRRIQSLINEQNSLEEKNKELLKNLQSEKLVNASLRQESFHWQKLYHESTVTANSYKVKLAEVARALKVRQREFDSSYPHLIHLTGLLTDTKAAIQSIISSLPHPDGECLLEQLHNSCNTNYNLNKKNGKPMKQTVNPMVKGMLITKPKIMLERIMLPQPQPDATNRDVTNILQENNQLTPIPEENDEENILGHISMRRPKRKLGSSWRKKQQEIVEKERKRVRANNTSSLSYEDDNDDFSVTENSPAIEHVEPVVLFRDVSRLLQNTSLLKVDAVHSDKNETRGTKFNNQSQKENIYHQRHLLRSIDDPLEGSSWMFNSITHRNFRSNSKTDSTDDEEDNEVVPTENCLNVSSSLDSLNIGNESLAVPKECAGSSLNPDTSTESPAAEPDSTNSMYIKPNSSLTETCHKKLSISHSVCNGISSQSNSNYEKHKSGKRSLACSMSLLSNDSNLSFNRKSSVILSENSSYSENKRRISEENCKRVRKPKVHIYPGEEDFAQDLKKRLSKLPKTCKMKDSCNKKKNHSKVEKTKRFSAGKSNELPAMSSKGSLSKIEKATYESGNKVENITRKKSSFLNRNTSTPRNSSIDVTYSDDGDSKSRRTRKPVCYKESPLNVKQRRP